MRQRRTKAQVEQLERQIYDVLQVDRPQSIRHVFYRMTDPRLPEPVEKTQRGYNQVQSRMTKMRRSGKLPYGWLTDMTRRGFHTNTFMDGGDFLSSMAGLYRGDLWEQADRYVEVWCESRSIAGTIDSVCEELAVSLYPAGGFASLTLAYDAAEYIKVASSGRPVEVLYIGDYDPAGVLIDRSLETELRKHLGADVELNFHRIGITPEQITRYDLPTKMRKKGERRAPEIEHTVEAEAMPAHMMRDLLRDAVEQFLPAHALSVVKEAEQSERECLEQLGLILQNNSIGDVLDSLRGGY